MKKKPYIINPSELSYICDHCSYLKKNYDLEDKGISVGVTQTLDGIEKNFFLGSTSKICDTLPKGEVIDPTNDTFFSEILKDNKNRKFRIKGKGDALIKFNDGTFGVIDYKTSKFKEKDGKSYQKELLKKIKEYSPQLHCYALLYSHLETNKEFLKKHTRAKKTDSIKKSVDAKLVKIKKIKTDIISRLGLVFVYPHEVISKNNLTIKFDHQYEDVKYDPENFMKFLTKYIDMLEGDNPPPIPPNCQVATNRQHCVMHNHFYDPKKLNGQLKNGR